MDKYGNDKQLWLLSFDFAKRYSEKISRTKFLKALLLHPNWINAWIEAAKYEYQWNKNPSNARLLYQRAISLNNKSPSLYLSFFKMEIDVIKQHLNWNFKESQKTDKDFNWKTQLKIFNQQTDEKNNKNDKNDKNDKHDKDGWLELIYAQMEVPKLIFRYAMKNIKGKLKYLMIKKFLLLIPTRNDLKQEELYKDKYNDDELNEKYDEIIARFGQLINYMFEYLEKHYYNDAIIIQILARKNLQIYSKNNNILNKSVEMSGCQVFERAMLLLSISHKNDNKKKKNKKKNKLTKQQREKFIIEILENFIKYLQNRMDFYIKLKQSIIEKRDDEEQDELSKNEMYLLKLYNDVMNYLVLRLLDSLNKLLKLSATKPSMFEDWILTLIQINQFDQALKVIKLATNEYPQSVQLWKLYSDLHCRQLAIVQDKNERNNHYRKALAACIKGIQCVSTKNAPFLWIKMIDVMIGQLTFLSLNKDDDDDNNNNNNNDSDSDSDSDTDIDMNGNNKQLIIKQVNAIHKAFKRGIQECLSNNDEIKEHYLKWMVIYHGNDKSKQLQVLNWFESQTMKCSPNIYKLILDIYESILLLFDMNDNKCIDKMVRFFEKGINEHGKIKPLIWVWYIKWSTKYQKLSQSSLIHERAIKTLNSDGLHTFLQHCQMIL